MASSQHKSFGAIADSQASQKVAKPQVWQPHSMQTHSCSNEEEPSLPFLESKYLRDPTTAHHSDEQPPLAESARVLPSVNCNNAKVQLASQCIVAWTSR